MLLTKIRVNAIGIHIVGIVRIFIVHFLNGPQDCFDEVVVVVVLVVVAKLPCHVSEMLVNNNKGKDITQVRLIILLQTCCFVVTRLIVICFDNE